MSRKFMAEMLGTFWLVFGGCGSALYAAAHASGNGIGFMGVAFAFGLTVLTMAYAIGHISGCHLNPAVSIGLWAGGRFDGRELLPYIAAQCLGACLAASCLFFIASGAAGWGGIDPLAAGTFATNGYGSMSPTGYSLAACFTAEVLLTAFFLFVIMGSTSKSAPVGFAPISIGLCLTLIHLISIPITNTSVNPARSFGVALYGGSAAMGQLWMFWAAPIIGACIGAFAYKFCAGESVQKSTVKGRRKARA